MPLVNKQGALLYLVKNYFKACFKASVLLVCSHEKLGRPKCPYVAVFKYIGLNKSNSLIKP